MYFNCSEKWKMLENDEKGKMLCLQMVLTAYFFCLLHGSLSCLTSSYLYGMFTLALVGILHMLFWNMLWTFCMLCIFLKYAFGPFFKMQLILIMQFWKIKMNLCMFLNCAFIYENKNSPLFCEPGEIPWFAKKGKLIPAVCF